MDSCKVKVNDRVKRISAPGCYGTVKDVRTEVTSTTPEQKEKGLMVVVEWDTGTRSYFSPDALEVVTG